MAYLVTSPDGEQHFAENVQELRKVIAVLQARFGEQCISIKAVGPCVGGQR